VSRPAFYRWLIVLGLVWGIANIPNRYGLAGFFFDIGFPFVFVSWWGSVYKGFDADAFAADLLIGFAFVVGLSWLCAWSRRTDGQPRSTQK
jgi:hypothetical protein